LSFFNLDNLYQEHFRKTYEFIQSGLTEDLDKDIETLETTIQGLYDYQGLDWVGRGDIFLVKNQASIAATEEILYDLKKRRRLL
jgi:hypothetical protein